MDNVLYLDIIKNSILPKYNLANADVEMVKFKDTIKQRAVFKVEHNGYLYCLKKVYYNEENLLYVYSAMEWLFRNGILVPKLLPTIDNNRYINVNGVLFILTPWIDGDKCDFDNMEHLILSSKTLGKLHKVSKHFTPIDGSATRKGFDDLNESTSKHFEQLLTSINKAQFYKDKFSKLFLDNLDSNLELAKLSVEISSSIVEENLSRSLCHGDFVNKNIIIANEDVWVIDFDKCKEDYSAKDLSYFLRRLLKRENTHWEKNTFLSIINNYMEENELTQDDLKFILAYVCFPQKFWKISRDYYKNIKKCNKNSFYLLLQSSIEKCENQLRFTYDIIDIFTKYYNITF